MFFKHFNLFIVCVYVWWFERAMPLLWKSEDSLQGSILFHQVGPRHQSGHQALRQGPLPAEPSCQLQGSNFKGLWFMIKRGSKAHEELLLTLKANSKIITSLI